MKKHWLKNSPSIRILSIIRITHRDRMYNYVTYQNMTVVTSNMNYEHYK